tara:strand:- start:1982 stop:2986 length:1005 start_codon:yes stop_codon:yes gene_type:complete
MKKFISNTLLICLSTIIALAIVEILLRANDNKLHEKFLYDKNEPTANKFDPIIGWELKEGEHIYKPINQEEKNFKTTITKDLYRFSGNTRKEKNDIIFLGGSNTFGYGVNDKETFSSLIQKKLKNYNIKNYGTAGYGTYQSLLKLEKILSKDNSIKYIVAIYHSSHEIRNIGNEEWLRTLSKHTNRNHLYLPYVSVDKKNELKKHKPVKYINLPLREKFIIIQKIEKKIMEAIFYSPRNNPTKATIKIFDEMNNLAKSNSSKLIVLKIHTIENFKSEYKVFFKKNNIKIIECFLPGDKNFVANNLIFKNDGHPNKRAHALYAECILKKLITLIE